MARTVTYDTETALRIYYMYPEIGNRQIEELFGIKGSAALRRKNEARKYQMENGIKTSAPNVVNTTAAYEVWGIDVKDLEMRRGKLKKLGLLA